MSKEILGTLLSKLGSPKDKEQFLEAMSLVSNEVGRRIILKAASPHSPVTIDEFPDIPETTMARHIYLLQSIGILEARWEKDKRTFAITELGKDIATIIT